MAVLEETDRFVRLGSAEGAKVAVFDMDLEAAEKVAADIRAAGGQAAAFQCNITDRAQVDAAVAATEAQLGPIAVLVNNAGWDIFKPFVKTVPDEWDKLIAINLTGALHMLHAVLPGMVERKYGRIVNVASDAARGGSSGEAVYAACKGGLVALSKTLAREHARQSITVNVVCPGPTDTALLAGVAEGARDPAKLIEAFKSAIPLGRLGQGDDLAAAIAFMGSDDASFVTGQVLSVSGGLTMHG
ncbi:MAG: SDR family oxidoreductase [Giesbergeria sp.]|nr:SDR family oxidoreductase [Giesbergeria sp.]